MPTTTTDPLDALLAIRNGYVGARWNFPDAVGTPVDHPGGIGNGVALSYSFLTSAPGYQSAAGFRAFTTAEASAARQVLADIAAVAGLAFAETAGTGQIAFGMNSQSGTAGYAYYPSFSYTYAPGGNILSVTTQVAGGDVWLNSGEGWTGADFVRGADGWGTLVHELGHALGLKHPFEAPADGFLLDPALDNKAWTVMSYDEHPHGLFRTVTDEGGGQFRWEYKYIQPETLMPLDIAALQYLYGANTSHRIGDDTYTFDPDTPFIRTIWDAGGVDTISVANFALGCEIDLRAGQFSSIRIPSDTLPPGITEADPPDLYDGTHNLAIAWGTTIENATGGSGNDRLIGNGAANRLDGGAGLDTMSGGGGNDTYVVKQSGDRVVENANAGNDLVLSSLGSYTLPAQVESGRVMSIGNANLTGNDLANVLYAGAGNNVLKGGAGNDTVDYRHAGAAVTVNLGLTTAQATGGSGSDTLQSIERVVGSSYADRFIGNGGANTLDGRGGGDRLTGGGGNDIFIVGHGGGADAITDFSSGADRIRIPQSVLRIGDGDTAVEGARTVNGPGGFAPSAEFVIVTRDIAGSLTTGSAAAAIGTAQSAYAKGATALFAVDNGASSALFVFTSAAADALVSAAELKLVATLTGAASTAVADYVFGA